MIRNDFVSNSSSSSYIVSLTKEEYESIKDYPKTILDLIIKNKEWNFGELGDPPDCRGDEFQKYGLYYGRRPKGVSKDKYYSTICPFIYQQTSEFKLTKENIDVIKKYKDCCDNCVEEKCTTRIKIQKMIEALEYDNIVMCFEIRNTDNFYIDDSDFNKLNDDHVLNLEDNH